MPDQAYSVAELVKISELKRCRDEGVVNSYLALGWLLLSIESHQHGPHDWITAYVIGWDRTNGEPKVPPPPVVLFAHPEDDSMPF